MLYLIFAHHHWAMSMVYNIVTDRAEDGSPHSAQASAAHHYHACLLLLSTLCDEMACILAEL